MTRQCSKNWLSTYMDYTERQESPELFHRWVGISCLASTMGRRFSLNRDAYTLYPNHYVILVADTAMCRKSTAVLIGSKLLDAAEVIEISAERITNADLWKQLGLLSESTGSAEMLTVADELSNYLSSEETHKGIVTTLTRLYMCPDYLENRTKTAGVDMLRNCCLNILAATTPRDLSEIIPSGATASGFVPRLHIVHQEVPRPKIYKPRLELSLRPKLIADLKHIRSIGGPMALSAEADRWFQDWYENELRPPEDPCLDGFYGRKHDYVAKLGMILSAAERDDRVIEKRYMTKALQFVEEIETFMPSMYEAVESTESLKYADLVLSQIRDHKQLTIGQLMRLQGRRMDQSELVEVIKFLETSQQIMSQPTTKGVVYRLAGRRRSE